MSFDLALWKWTVPNPKDIDADGVYDDLIRDQEHPLVAPFDRNALESALAQWFGVPTIDSVDAFSCAPVFRGLVIHIAWDHVDELVPRIKKFAASYGFYCYDPQQSTGIPSIEPTKKELQSEFERTKQKAESGQPEAQARLGFFYEFGEGVAKNLKSAAAWYAKGAEQGNREALFNLAGCFRNGTGVDKDVLKAAEIYEQLADLEDEDAMLELAKMYETGDGVPKDAPKALALYRRAAEKGVSDAKKAILRLSHK